MKKISLFDHLDNLTIHKENFDLQNDTQSKSYSKYMINRFISMIDIYIPVVNEINQYDVPDDVHYNYYYNALPKRKHFFKYISQKKQMDDETKDLLCEYYKCSYKELDYHLQVLTKEQIENIIKVFKR